MANIQLGCKKPFSSLYVFTVLDCEKRPDRVDVCIVVDTNEKYGQRLTDAVKVIDSLIEKISISPSTSRLMLITATPEVKVQIHLNSCTNRECIQADLRKIRFYFYRILISLWAEIFFLQRI